MEFYKMVVFILGIMAGISILNFILFRNLKTEEEISGSIIFVLYYVFAIVLTETIKFFPLFFKWILP